MRPITRMPYILAVICALVTCSGCGWKHKLTFLSPDGRSSIEIYQPYIAESWDLRIDLVRDGGSTVLKKGPTDAILTFLHAYWSPQGRVAVFGVGSTRVELAYDLVGNRFIPFSEMSEEMKTDIARTYSLRQVRVNRVLVNDPLLWAYSKEAGRLSPPGIPALARIDCVAPPLGSTLFCATMS